MPAASKEKLTKSDGKLTKKCAIGVVGTRPKIAIWQLGIKRMELKKMARYLIQAAFAFGTAISVFLSAPVFLEKKAAQGAVSASDNETDAKKKHDSEKQDESSGVNGCGNTPCN